MKILFIDTETGGLDPQKHSLLSIGLAVWDNSNIIASTEIFINDGNNIHTKRAISINKIDLKEHNDVAISSKQALSELIKFIELHFDVNSSVTLAGHNVSFDISFIKQLFKTNRRDFSRYFSHRSIDTSSILSYLQICQIIKMPLKSSSDAFRHFDIKVNNRHSALGDALATANLFNKLIDLLTNKKCNY